ncbi:MAG: enoyl-CoA hydratase/isomerase family protein [Burkholderiaceae bacterium]
MAGTPALRIDGAVARIELNRPYQANRLGPDDLEALAAHIAAVDADPAVRVLQFAAHGRYFCSGYDISRIATARTVDFEAVVNAVEDARPVTIAILQGGVYGGATDLALACDFRLGAKGIDLFMPAARLGLHYYRRGLERYVSRLGLDEAKRLFLTAERIDSAQMKAIGYLTHLEAPEALAEAADRLATRLVEMAPIPLFGMKKHLNRIARGALDVDELLSDIDRAAHSADLEEGKAAWAQKRPPRFTGS